MRGRIHQAGCNGCIGMGQAPATGRISVRTVPRNFPGRSGTREDQVYGARKRRAGRRRMTLDVRHDPRRERFTAALEGGREAVLDYSTPREGVIDLESTVVPAKLRGRGFGRQLVRHVLDFARSSGLRVVPTCPFVARVIEEQPEYRDLVA